MSTHSQALKEFLIESHENLDLLDRDFVALEETPADVERIRQIFRTIHTIKGTAGFFKFSTLESLTHSGEALLSLMRDGELALTPAITSALLLMADRVRVILRSIENDGKEGTTPIVDVVTLLEQLKKQPAHNKNVAPPPDKASNETVVKKLEVAPAASAEPTPQPAPQPAAVEISPNTSTSPPRPASTDSGSSQLSDSNVRVDVDLLDQLMNLVGELVLSRNQIVQYSDGRQDTTLLRMAQRLNLITSELQERIMKTRMQPVGNVWGKLPRTIRDLALTCGKQVRIEMVGKEIELDRTVLEAIKDPLTHIVRNAVDHGLEAPDVRVQRGKPRTGTLRLLAYHESGQVIIEISDDGGGIDLDTVKRKAVERRLITPDAAARLTQDELTHLIFLPGFSTAEKVTNVSGRGVGMDVVKTNIDKIGGNIEIQTSPGHGTVMKIKIPLTLTIVPALLVSSGGQEYAVPQLNLHELVRLEPNQARTSIEWLMQTPLYRSRGKLLPLVFLNHQLRGQPVTPEQLMSAPINIVVLQADNRQFGVVVDDVRDTEEIVVRPLGKELKGLNVFAGATIMGDGEVALILDVVGLAQHSGVLALTREQADLTHQKKDVANDPAPTKTLQEILLFGVGNDKTMAVPLSTVTRLEEFLPARVEAAGHRKVVQYGGGVLPLLDLAKIMGFPPLPATRPLQVIVFTQGKRNVGIVVESIVDVIEEELKLEAGSGTPGVLGSAVLMGKVMNVLDAHNLITVHDVEQPERSL